VGTLTELGIGGWDAGNDHDRGSRALRGPSIHKRMASRQSRWPCGGMVPLILAQRILTRGQSCHQYTQTILAKREALSRPQGRLSLCRANWHDEPVRLDCGSEPVSANAASKLFFGILASVAEFEKACIAERMKEGRTGKRARGGHPGGSAPYGYRVEGEGRLAMFVAEQTEQDMIATMRKLCGYMSLRKLAEKLDQDGIRTRRGTAFSPMHLHRILSRG
jgi:hypothetical protein